MAKKVLLIGWDAADWKVINPFMDAGEMPALERLVNSGSMGRIATLDPPLSPMLWSSIGTGKRPYKHGVLGFTEPRPDGSGVQPVLSTTRKVKAIWNILSEKGFKTHVVGWWPSHPAEDINGISISNFYQKDSNPKNGWKMADGAVAPADKAEFFKKLRVHPSELTNAHILPFVPEAAKVDQKKDNRLVKLAKFTAHAASIQAASTYILEHEPWDFMAVYFDALDHYSHAFMKYHPPKMDKVSQEDFDLYQHVIKSAYKYHDMMLDRMLQLAGPDTTVILVSDHGFHPGNLRPKELPKDPAAPAYEHSPYGIFCVRGPNIRKDELIYGANVLDVTPTVLSLFGLPLGKDMDGKPLINIYEKPPPLDRIETWEEGGKEFHPNTTYNSGMDKEVLQQLVDLGYIEKPPEDPKKAVKQTINENNFYLARAYLDGGKYQEAQAILKDLYDENPGKPRYGIRLASALLALNQLEESRSVLDTLKKRKGLSAPSIGMLEGTLLLKERKYKEAGEVFQETMREAPDMKNLHLQLGRSFQKLKDHKRAESAFLRELEINPESPAAYYGLGLTCLHTKRYEEAVERFLSAIGLLYAFPFAHFHLGEALMNLKEYRYAADAFEVALTLAPRLHKAREYLITIYSAHIKDPKKVKSLKKDIRTKAAGEMIVVSGLPRSGTSMMMQMLDAAGLELFTDHVRPADASNPKGYYEHEAVKQLAHNKTWLPKAAGKVVKVISLLLMQLPPRFKYKVIFMRRNIYEILESQEKMLVRDGKRKKRRKEISLGFLKQYENNVEQVEKWAKEKRNVEILYVDYKDVVGQPEKEAVRISEFLGKPLDTKKVIAVVDEGLYREKAK